MKIFVFPLSQLSLLLLASLLAFGSCTDSITVGSDLLDDDRVTIGFNSNLEISATTVPNDSVRIFDASSGARLSRHLLGFVEDGLFGGSRRDIYITPEILSDGQGMPLAPVFVDQDSFELDSVVLILPYDTTDLYGAIYGTSMEYEVYEVLELFPGDEDFNSNETLAVSDQPLSTGSFSISSEARLVSDTLVEDSTLVHHIRIPLPGEIVERIRTADSTLYVGDSTFQQSVFAGLQIRISSPAAGFLNINARNIEAGFNAYFTKIDSSQISFYPFDFDFILANYSFDRTGSLAESLLDNTSPEAVTMIEGAGGLMTQVDILDLDTLIGRVINQAQLEFYLDESRGFDYESLPPSQSVVLFYKDADGRTQVIEDVEVLPVSTSAANRLFFLGGDLETDEDERRLYRVNLSVHLQSIADGELPPTIFIRAIPADIAPNKMILRGVNDPEFPMTLRVAFTQF